MTETAKAGCALALAVLVVAGLCVAGCATRFAGRVANLADREFGPEAALKKYEEFKDIAAALDAKLATIKVAEGRLAALEKQYEGTPRKDWPRTDLEQHSLWAQEVAGMKASFNQLAADYNARMAKFNYAFAEAGSLPQGADKPLPREYKPYVTN